MATPVDLGDTVALMLESLALSEASMRTTFTWAGQEYPCTGGPEFGGKRIGEGGWRVHARLTLKVRIEVFPSGIDVPQEKQRILYKRNASAVPKEYLIDSTTDFYGAILQLECIHPNEAA